MPFADLNELKETGALEDAELDQAKAKPLGYGER